MENQKKGIVVPHGTRLESTQIKQVMCRSEWECFYKAHTATIGPERQGYVVKHKNQH